MPYTRESLAETRAVLDAALVRDEGLLLTFEDGASLTAFLHRAYTARSQERAEARKLLVSDPGYGRSPYDRLRFRRTGLQLEIKAGEGYKALGIKSVTDLDSGEEVPEGEL